MIHFEMTNEEKRTVGSKIYTALGILFPCIAALLLLSSCAPERSETNPSIEFRHISMESIEHKQSQGRVRAPPILAPDLLTINAIQKELETDPGLQLNYIEDREFENGKVYRIYEVFPLTDTFAGIPENGGAILIIGL